MLCLLYLGTESTTSEEDGIPPPLPAKQRESDYCNLPSYNSTNNLYQSAPPLTPIRVRNKV